MSLSVSGFFFKWPCAPAKAHLAQNCKTAPISHKSKRACQAQTRQARQWRSKNGTSVDQAQAQNQTQACRLINHDMQHFNIRFAHALAGQTGNTADGFFHIALHNALASGKNLALHGEIVGSDGGIHRQ